MTNPDVRRHIHDAKNDLTDALGHLQKLIPRATTIQRLTPTGDPGCLDHRKAGVYVPSGPVKGACRWHYDFTRQHGRPAPPDLTRHHDAGYNLSPGMVDRALKGKKQAAPRTKPPKPTTRRTRLRDRLNESAKRLTHGLP